MTTTVDGNSGGTAVTTTTLASSLPTYVPGYIYGLTLSTAGSSATFGVATGSAMNSTATANMALASAYTKTTSAWAVGTSNGSLDTGAIANSTWYHVHLIQRPDTGVVDVLISLSATAPTMPTNYTLFRRIGSMKTNGSAQWTSFLQIGDWFYIVPIQDFSGYRATALLTLSLPSGVSVQPLLAVQSLGGGNASTTISVGPASGGGTFMWLVNGSYEGQAGGDWVYSAVVGPHTNTSGQIYMGNPTYYAGSAVTTAGWVDNRGRGA